MTYEQKHQMREGIYQHLNILLGKVQKMFSDSGDLTIAQMIDGSKILKNIAKADSAMSKSCYYDSQHADTDGKKY